MCFSPLLRPVPLAHSWSCTHSGAVVDSSDLLATDASVDSSSGASIKVFAGDRFDGDASSGSSIRVYGSPEVAESETSSGASIDLRHTQTI